MKSLNFSSISRKLMLLILFSVMPCLAILLYSGLELRQHLIEDAQANVLLITHNMALSQREITQSTKQILSTLSLLPSIQDMDPIASSAIFRAVLEQNPNFNNIGLVDLGGEVLASGKPFTETNLADRKHVKDALKKNVFAAGEYIITRVGTANPSFAFACPIIGKKGKPKGILTAAIKLEVFSNFYNASTLPEKSFLAITDHKGIRLLYYPDQNNTNPVGKPIQSEVWNMAFKGEEHGLFFAAGSDGLGRIFAYEKVHLNHEDTPYIYVWAGIPEDYLLRPANKSLIRNLLLMLLTTVMSLFIAWVIGKKTLIYPIQNLVALTRKFTRGDFEARSELIANGGEVGILTEAFHDMAEALIISRRTLQQSEQKFRTIADFAYDWEYWIDPDGQFIYLSPSCERITGYTPEEIISDPLLVSKMVKPDYVEKVHHHYFDKDNEDSSAFPLEFPIFTKNGGEVWLENNCRLVYDDQGNYAGRRGNNRDITQKKVMEASLQQSQKMESIGTLAGGIAHDFNNILSGIFGFSQLAERHLDDPDKVKKYIDQIFKGAQKAAELVQQILTVSRKSIHEMKPIHVYTIINDALKLLRATIPTTMEIKEDIVSKARVMGDPIQIHQIVMNLCTNAYHAMLGNGGEMSVSLKEIEFSKGHCIPGLDTMPGRYISLEVSDTGSGMDSRIIKRIFDPYFTTKEPGKGTGLGLAIVFSIVEEHKGYIHVHSNPGLGSTFYVYLPIIEESPSPSMLKEKEVQLSGRETIMFVDDEESLREMMYEILKASGYMVYTFSNGTQAFNAYKKDPFLFDLIITDMAMPGITGFEMSQKMLKLRPEQPVVLCTGYSESIDRELAITMGVTEYFEKPFIVNKIDKLIRKVLDDAKRKS